MSHRNRPLRIAACAALSTALVAGCSSLSGGEGEERAITVGTTSAPTSLDPAASWDGSFELYRNVYQTLLQVPASSRRPEPDAAKSCKFTDDASRVYRCTLEDGLKFSSGNPVDAAAVKHSIERIRTINSEAGPAGLLGSLERVETPDRRTVVFHLKKSDANFPFVLTTPATSLVDPEAYPADKVRSGNGVVGSGPYRLVSYKEGEQAVLKKYTGYKGPEEQKNSGVTIRYYHTSDEMVSALKKEQIDLTYRGLAPRQVDELRKEKGKGDFAGTDLHELAGSETRFLVFNGRDETAGNPAVRKAVAQVVDRDALIRKVYKGTADALYSMVPTGIPGHTSAFYDTYGAPSVSKARKTLSEAGINGKVSLSLAYTTDRYGAATAREFAELKQQLEASGLFRVELEGHSWKTFQKGYNSGKYQVFGRGWFADYPDADNYVAPFVGKHNAIGTPYESRQLTGQLLPQYRKKRDRDAAAKDFARIQSILAEDARLLPLWQGRTYIAAAEDIAGIEWSLDPSVIMHVGELYRKSSW